MKREAKQRGRAHAKMDSGEVTVCFEMERSRRGREPRQLVSGVAALPAPPASTRTRWFTSSRYMHAWIRHKGPARVSERQEKRSHTLGGQTLSELFKRVTNGFHSVINHFMQPESDGGGGAIEGSWQSCLFFGSALFGPNWTETAHTHLH